jgi:glutamate synthase domain-containing protein 1
MEENMEILDQFVYIGVSLNFNGKCFVPQKQLGSQSSKEVFALKASTKTIVLKSVYLIIPI